MRTRSRNVVLSIGAGMGLLAALAFAGDLNPPPGPINPTDRFTINQQAVGALPFVINQPGSYKLTSDLIGAAGNGVEILVDNVTLDLNGFTIDSGGAVGTGVLAAAPVRNVVVRNGNVTGWGVDGVDLQMATDCRVENVNARANAGVGIRVASSHVVGCLAGDNAASGIEASVNSVIERCIARGNLGGPGVSANEHCLVSNCTATGNSGDGFLGLQGTEILRCTATDNGGTGILVDFGGVVRDCLARRNTDGIIGIDNCSIIDSSSIENFNLGVFADIGTLVRGCTVRLNVTVGIECGFENLGYFYRCFKSRFGCTPRRYRLRARQTVGRA